MAGSLKTANYNLSKYAPNDITSWLVDFNGNMDKIDTQMKANEDANAGISGDIAGIHQNVTALEGKTSDLENAVDVLKEKTTTDAIVASYSSNTVSLAVNIYKIGDLIQGCMYAAINKNGNKLSVIDFSNPNGKLIPMALLSENPLNLPIVSTPTSSNLMDIGTCVLKNTDSGTINTYNLSLLAYYNGTNTIIAINIGNGLLVSDVTFIDATINICKKILD